MHERQALRAFGALSQETRLRMPRHLRGPECAGLVAARRDSRPIVYSAAYEAVTELIRFPMEDRCSGKAENCTPALSRDKDWI